MSKRGSIAVLIALVAVVTLWVAWAKWSTSNTHTESHTEPSAQKAHRQVQDIRRERQRLDESVWSKEVLAQKYEQTFIRLWDDLRIADDKLQVLAKLPFSVLKIGKPRSKRTLEGGIAETILGPGDALSPQQWGELLESLKRQGFELVQSEWHHATFDEDPDGQRRSTVSMTLHVVNKQAGLFVDVGGKLKIDWSSKPDSYVPEVIDATDLTLRARPGAPVFKEEVKIESQIIFGEDPPILVYDLNRDGLPEIVKPFTNSIYWNRGGRDFEKAEFLPEPKTKQKTPEAVFADFNGDGLTDYLCAARDVTSGGAPTLFLYYGNERGMFPTPPISPISLSATLYLPSFAVGDIDGDDDLDVWVGQYKALFKLGQMPTPFYDSNDGFPGFLLLNDGTGQFVDATESAGLAAKRFRRTYRACFIDLDDDNDLDLLTVNDFAGLDVHFNDGSGHFTDRTASTVDERANFGMSACFGDFNLDGRLDFYVTGMASTTMRRLEHMELFREGFDDIQKMRKVMGYGNRMYLSVGQGSYRHPSFNDSVARSGWSWGVTDIDFDNDGDSDIYVANGHISGESAEDYCTRFWTHDIYTGDAKNNPVLGLVFKDELRGLRQKKTSWNGYEKNHLFMNLGGKDFVNVAFLMGVAVQQDCRQVVAEDFDGDGRRDLLITGNDGRHGPGRDGRFVSLFFNRWPVPNNWIGVRLEDEPGLSPIGAKVSVAYGNRVQVARYVIGNSFYSQNSNTKHFGLGQVDRVDSITVRWLNGSVAKLDNPAVNRYHLIRP